MTPTSMNTKCKACNHTWVTTLHLPMPLERFCKVLDALTTIGCPGCGAYGNNVLVGGTVNPEAPSSTPQAPAAAKSPAPARRRRGARS